MVEDRKADPPTGKLGAGLLLANRLKGMSLDLRVQRLNSFVTKCVLYDEALSATQVSLVKDEENDLVSD